MSFKKAAFFIALSIGLFQTNLFAQELFQEDTVRDPAHLFLWFKGHWNPNNKRQFIIDKDQSGASPGAGGGGSASGNGGTVNVTPGGEVQINSDGSNHWNKKIDDGLNDLKKFEDDLNGSRSSSEWRYHLFQVLNPELEDLKKTWQDNKIDTKGDALNQDSKQDDAASAMKKFSSNLDYGCQKMKAKYDAIMDFYNAHKHDDESSYNNPVPPEYDAQCVSCDSAKRIMGHQKANHYVKNFFKPEEDLTRDAMSILRDAFLLGRATDIDGDLSHTYMDDAMQQKVESAFGKKGACSFYDDYKLHNAIVFLMERQYWRAQKLFKDYKNNVKTAEAVIKTLLTASRNCSLMCIGVGGDNDLAVCKPLVKKALDFYADKLLKEHDWSQLGNIPFIFGLDREYSMLGDGPETHVLQQITELLKGFRLQIELNSEIGTQKGNALAHVKGEAKIAPEFKYDQDSCYRWVVVEGTDPSGFPLKQPDQKINCDVLTNEIHVPDMAPTYIGTRKYFVRLEGLKMDYCFPGQDSIFLTTFIPDGANTWKVPHDPRPEKWGINGTDAVFMNINKMKQMAESGKLKQEAEMMKQDKQKLIAQMQQAQAQMQSGGQNRMAGYQKMLDLSTQAQSMGADVAPVQFIDFPLEMQNRTATLFDKSFDAKEINTQEAKAVVYSKYKVTIVYKGP